MRAKLRYCPRTCQAPRDSAGDFQAPESRDAFRRFFVDFANRSGIAAALLVVKDGGFSADYGSGHMSHFAKPAAIRSLFHSPPHRSALKTSGGVVAKSGER